MTQNYWVYILLCNNNSLYTGSTNNLEKRFQAHKDGSSRCKFTRSFKPIKIMQSWMLDDKKTALQIERAIKKLRKVDKEKIIINPTYLYELLNYQTPEID